MVWRLRRASALPVALKLSETMQAKDDYSRTMQWELGVGKRSVRSLRSLKGTDRDVKDQGAYIPAGLQDPLSPERN